MATKISASSKCQLRSKMFTLIACVGQKNEIGKKGQLVFDIKKDMEFFTKTTTGHPVVMGYNTWLSLPKKLKNRKNIVISYEDFEGPDEVVTNLDQFIENHESSDKEYFIIGGGMIYHRFLPHANSIYLTEVDATVPDADVFFPEFDKTKYNKIVIEEGDGPLTYTIVKYTKKKEVK